MRSIATVAVLAVVFLAGCGAEPYPGNAALMAASRDPVSDAVGRIYGPDDRVFCSFPNSANPHLVKVELAARPCAVGGGVILGPAGTEAAAASTLGPGALVDLSNQQQQIIRAGIAKGLKDPESVRFGKLAGTRDKDGSITVCGYLNAKNSYGGYVGMSPFLGVLLAPPRGNSFELVRLASTPTERQAVVATCGQAGVPMSL